MIDQEAKYPTMVIRPHPEVLQQAEAASDGAILQLLFASTTRPDSLSFVRTVAATTGSKIYVDESTATVAYVTPRPKIFEFFPPNKFETQREAYQKEQRIQGHHLLLAKSVPSLEMAHVARREILWFVSFLRINFGDVFARELRHEALFLKQGSGWKPQMSISVAPDFRELTKDHIVPDCTAKGPYKVVDAAAEIISLIEPVTTLPVRFLLLWTALEYQLADQPGSNPGKKRERFASYTLKSKEMNIELRRLHKIRSALLKDGDLEVLDHFDEFSLRSILRLTTFGPSPLLERLTQVHIERIRLHESGDHSFYQDHDLFLTVEQEAFRSK